MIAYVAGTVIQRPHHSPCISQIMTESDIASTFIPALHKPVALLPIAQHKQTLLYSVETYSVVIVIGQTGSGKTTQIPQFLERAGWCSDGKVVAVTQVSNNSTHHCTED